eukprot:c1911_g1_i1.p1 GENE.c1911_g1_i1~~c1911_g1_i1.p1  ORF type:complete len:533 (+),score=103.40 c1911_g1_i1:53-1651(+)
MSGVLKSGEDMVKTGLWAGKTIVKAGVAKAGGRLVMLVSIRRKVALKRFHVFFIVNLVLSVAYFTFEMLDSWFGDPASQLCFKSLGQWPEIWHSTLMLFQICSQLALLRQAPASLIGDDKYTPFSGSSKHKFFTHWWMYLVFTICQQGVAIRMILTCGIVCDDYCVSHWIRTVGEWVLLVFHFCFIVITWSPGFRKSFPITVEIDPSLHNPPVWDPSIRQNIRLTFKDAANFPALPRGVSFAVLLINYSQPFRYDKAAWMAAHPDQSLEVSKQFRDELETSVVSTIPESRQGHPRVIRIGTIRTGSESHGWLSITWSHLRIPESLEIPTGTILRVLPSAQDDRELIPISNGPIDIAVLSNAHQRAERPPLTDIMICHHPNSTQLAASVKEFFIGNGFTAFTSQDAISATQAPVGEDDEAQEASQIGAQYSTYCRYFVVLFEAQWGDNDQCLLELSVAHSMALRTKCPVLMPVIDLRNDFWNRIQKSPIIAGILTHVNGTVLDPDDLDATRSCLLQKIQEHTKSTPGLASSLN